MYHDRPAGMRGEIAASCAVHGARPSFVQGMRPEDDDVVMVDVAVWNIHPRRQRLRLPKRKHLVSISSGPEVPELCIL